MTARAMSRKMALATILLLPAVMSAACGREADHLTAPTLPTASLSSSSLPSTVIWQLTWTGNAQQCGATWYWQLSDSSWVAGGQPVGCNGQASPMSGTDIVPSNAIALRLTISVSDRACSNAKTISKSFKNQQNLTISISSQLPNFEVEVQPISGIKIRIPCTTASASVSLQS